MEDFKHQGVSRFSVSLNKQLLASLDEMVSEKGYTNRSQAIADMVRDHLVEHRQHQGNQEIAGTITLLYNHHKRDLQAVLTDIQHDHEKIIISTVHAHLDHDNCMEVLLVRGKSNEIKAIADKLIGAKGVKHGKLTVTSTDHDLTV